MDIIDVTYNFELYEELALRANKEFVQTIDAITEMKELWDVTSRMSEIDKTDGYFQEFYKRFFADDGELYKQGYEKTRKDIKGQIIEALGQLKVATKKMEDSFNVLIALMRSRVEYIETSHTQDELYGNYKLRTERNDLNRKIKKYENVIEANLSLANKYSLSTFGFEVEGEPGLQ